VKRRRCITKPSRPIKTSFFEKLFYVEHGSTEDQEKAIYWLDRFIEKNPESVIAYLI
jgi:hypothetical protein